VASDKWQASSYQLPVTSYKYNGERPKPGDWRKETGCRWQCLGEVEAVLKKRKEKIAAAIIEPVVQGAAGIMVMPPGYLRGFADLCKKYDVLLIADEVAVGFGRTGKMFACEHEKVQPDLMCLAKGITGGYLPLAVTAASEKIYQAFLGRYDEFKSFFHGHTYTANPLACAASLANLQIFQTERTLQKIRKLEEIFSKLLSGLAGIPMVGQVRQAGMMAGIELVKDKNKMISFPPGFRLGKKICYAARKHGILLRPLGDTIVLMPPFSITEKELHKLVEGVRKGILKFQPRNRD
jgi:adenosylmethionine-8-amino-7-oxononanoate aminotransferase